MKVLDVGKYTISFGWFEFIAQYFDK